jgi:hypothetical protein
MRGGRDNEWVGWGGGVETGGRESVGGR